MEAMEIGNKIFERISESYKKHCEINKGCDISMLDFAAGYHAALSDLFDDSKIARQNLIKRLDIN